jgi:hypothetical protein
MHRQVYFWYTTLARGVVALFAGSAIWFIPEMAGSLLLLPMAFAFSVLALASYGVIDSSFIFLSSMMTRSKLAALALRLQGAVGITVGVLIFAVVYERVRLEWFLLLAAVQALCTFVAEIMVAHQTHSHAKTVWNYGAAAVAFCFGCAYLVLRFRYADVLESRTICLLIYGYLLAFGFFQVLTATRMLYAGHHHLRRTAARSSELPKPSADQMAVRQPDAPDEQGLAQQTTSKRLLKVCGGEHL